MVLFNRVGSTSLHFAARQGNMKLVRWLLQNGAHASLNIKNKLGCRPLDLARIFGPYPEVEAQLGVVMLDKHFQMRFALRQGRRLLDPEDATRSRSRMRASPGPLPTVEGAPSSEVRDANATSRVSVQQALVQDAETDGATVLSLIEAFPRDSSSARVHRSSLVRVTAHTGGSLPRRLPTHEGSVFSLSTIGARAGTYDERLDATVARHELLESRLELMEGRRQSQIDSIDARLDSMDAKFTARLDRLEELLSARVTAERSAGGLPGQTSSIVAR